MTVQPTIQLPSEGQLTASAILVALREAYGVPLRSSSSAVEWSAETAVPRWIQGDTTHSGDVAAARLLALEMATALPSLRHVYGADEAERAQVDRWLEQLSTGFVAVAQAPSPSDAIEKLVRQMDAHLMDHSFLAGYEPTLADFYAYARLRNQRKRRPPPDKHHTPTDAAAQELDWVLPADTLRKLRSQYRAFSRWLLFIESLPYVEACTARAQEAASAAVSGWDNVMRLAKASGSFDIGLPGAEYDRVVTRFPPEPSGYLHIGHTKALLLNDYFAKVYGGRLLLRFDDTNPSKEKQEYEESILADCRALGVQPDRIEWTSDYFAVLLEWCERFLRRGQAYVDRTPVEQMREQRLQCIDSAYRNQSVEENLRLWQAMQSGDAAAAGCCVRAKIDMQAKNASLRDPVIYRTAAAAAVTPAETTAATSAAIEPVPVEHHRTGRQYRVYPSYDFACPIVDSLEGVTHALRTSEYQDREAQYRWVCEAAGLRCPTVWTYSRLSFVHTVLSKRKLTWLVAHGYVDGWDDPRMPTVRGVLRRGMQVDALRAFILSQGPSRNITVQQWDKIWTMNKRVIDPIAPRHTAIVRQGHWRLRVRGVVHQDKEQQQHAAGNSVVRHVDGTAAVVRTVIRTVPRHRKNPACGNKALLLADEVLLEPEDAASVAVEEIVTLMDLGNVRVTQVRADERCLEGEYLPEHRDFKRTKKFTWLAAVPDLVPVQLIHYGPLLRKDKLEDGDDIRDHAIPNAESKTVVSALADVNVRLLSADTVIQFERRGYYRCDRAWVRPGTDMEFVDVPDGHVAQTPR
ncbi:hypothetical protein CDCA_CDCA20G4785 [Cyanidium caldarium]|uniref:glutamate--tRNA ligase n=1 Tax=Cyanidium caldarium TaxID=2771 RepID=A0AAV9J2G4_CYACA|nr:hypothetical protein CDCA_CDCA20G4785 [Cyanidium caldarium]